MINPAEWSIDNVPLPPSVNGLYGRNRYGGVFLKKSVTTWRKTFGQLLMTMRRPKFTDKWSIVIMVPWRMAGDTDNRIKVVQDALVKFEITSDDRHCVDSRCLRSPGRQASEGCKIIVRSAQEQVAA